MSHMEDNESSARKWLSKTNSKHKSKELSFYKRWREKNEKNIMEIEIIDESFSSSWPIDLFHLPQNSRISESSKENQKVPEILEKSYEEKPYISSQVVFPSLQTVPLEIEYKLPKCTVLLEKLSYLGTSYVCSVCERICKSKERLNDPFWSLSITIGLAHREIHVVIFTHGLFYILVHRYKTVRKKKLDSLRQQFYAKKAVKFITCIPPRVTVLILNEFGPKWFFSRLLVEFFQYKSIMGITYTI